jgi:hypothetical protein
LLVEEDMLISKSRNAEQETQHKWQSNIQTSSARSGAKLQKIQEHRVRGYLEKDTTIWLNQTVEHFGNVKATPLLFIITFCNDFIWRMPRNYVVHKNTTMAWTYNIRRQQQQCQMIVNQTCNKNVLCGEMPRFLFADKM